MLIVVGTLLLVLVWRLDRAVSTAYASEWRAGGLRLPSERWQWAYAVSGVLAVLALVVAALLWRRRTRGSVTTGDLAATSLVTSALAVALATGAGVARYLAAEDAGPGALTWVTALNLVALACVAALALITGNLVYRDGGGLTRHLKVVVTRQRMNLVVALLLAAALLFVGQTSGQAVDSIRSWAPYLFGDAGGWSAAGVARLTLGLAAAALFALGLFESGVRLNKTPAGLDDPNGTRIVAVGAVLVVVGGALLWPLDLPFGPGLLLFGVGLLLVALLEAPNMRGEELKSALPSSPAVLNAPEWIAITPLLALAGTSVTATVEAALSSGAGVSGGTSSNWIVTILPAIALGALAVLLTRQPDAWNRSVLGVGSADLVVWISIVLVGSVIVVVIAEPLGAALSGCFWLFVLVWYAWQCFPFRRRPEAEAEPETEAESSSRIVILVPLGAWLTRLAEKLHVPAPLVQAAGPVDSIRPRARDRRRARGLLRRPLAADRDRTHAGRLHGHAARARVRAAVHAPRRDERRCACGHRHCSGGSGSRSSPCCPCC